MYTFLALDPAIIVSNENNINIIRMIKKNKSVSILKTLSALRILNSYGHIIEYNR